MTEQVKPTPAMPGFDPEFGSLPDYILKITAKIWEERGIGPALRRYYADQVIVRASTGVLTSNEQVIQATLATLHEFPDRRLLGEDVIWAEDPNGGYFSSHRLNCTVTHAGDGVYGPATGKKLRYRIIADCAVRDNQIYDEWLARDQGAIAVCLGMTPRELAQAQIDAGMTAVFTPDLDVAGLYNPVISDHPEAQAYAALWQRIFNEADLQAVQQGYHEAANLYVPNNAMAVGQTEADGFFVGLKASFPDSQLTLEQLTCRQDPGHPTRIAMRWTLSGTHTGYGVYGNPTGKTVFVRGYCHAHWIDGRVTHEWITYDDVAIWKQLLPVPA